MRKVRLQGGVLNPPPPPPPPTDHVCKKKLAIKTDPSRKFAKFYSKYNSKIQLTTSVFKNVEVKIFEISAIGKRKT